MKTPNHKRETAQQNKRLKMKMVTTMLKEKLQKQNTQIRPMKPAACRKEKRPPPIEQASPLSRDERENDPSLSRYSERNRDRKSTKLGHSTSTWCTVSGTKQSSQKGGGDPSIKNPWENLVWPIRSRHKAVSHLRGKPTYLKEPNVEQRARSLLEPTTSQHSCQ